MADSSPLIRAAELLELDATSLRECHNVDPLQPDWKDEEEAKEAHDEALAIAGQLRGLITEIQALQGGLAREKERADYAWRNTNIVEKARQEKMERCDTLTRTLLRAEAFIAGFEGDEAQEGIDELLMEIRGAASA